MKILNKYRKQFEKMLHYIYIILVGMVIIKLLFLYLVAMIKVSGISMTPTFQDRQMVLCNRLSYRFDNPERFDVIVFECEDIDNKLLIKRIIGLPGEKLKIDINGNIYVNGNMLNDVEGLDTIINPGLAIEEIRIPENAYFVLGDNRNNSVDSRFSMVGFIDKKDILGKCYE